MRGFVFNGHVSGSFTFCAKPTNSGLDVPLPIAHGLVGATAVAALYPGPLSKRGYRPFLIGALLANAADFDFLLVFIFHSKSWHRGFSHSLGFALLMFLMWTLLLGKRRLQAAIAYGAAFASHAILDWLTTKEGSGVELLWPFSQHRLMLGWRGLSEMASQLPPVQILQAVAVEFALFAPLLLGVVWLRRKLAANNATSTHSAKTTNF